MGKNRNRINGSDLEDDLEEEIGGGTDLPGTNEDLKEVEAGTDLGAPTGAVEPESIVTGMVAKEEEVVKEIKTEEAVNEAIDNFIDKTAAAMEKLEGGELGMRNEGFAGLAPLAEEVKVEVKEFVATPDATKKTTGFYVPKKYTTEKEVSKEIIKEADKAKINVILEKELTGTGASEISGQVDVHIKTADIVEAVKRIIGKVSEETTKIKGVKSDIFENFVNGIVGVSSTLSYDMGGLPLTAANFHREATAKILADNPSLQQAQAVAKAAEIVSGYIGKNIDELKNAASSLPVKFLTLVVKRTAIPKVNGKDDKNALDLIANCFTSEYVKSVIAEQEGEVLHIAINMSRIFKYAQGHFKAADLENIQMISATILSTNNSTHSVVYRVNKKSALQK